MRTQTIEQLLSILNQEGVPISLSVPFLVKARGLEIKELARRAGCHRALVGMALRGDRTPPVTLRRAVKDVLGVDPWLFSESRR